MRMYLWMLALAGISWIQVQPAVAAEPQPPTLQQLLYPVGARSALLSPDGQHIAVLTSNGAGGSLLLIETGTLAQRSLFVSKRSHNGAWTYNKSPQRVEWVTNSLLAVDFGFGGAELRDLQGNRLRDLGTGLIGKAKPDDPDNTELLVYDDDERTRISRLDVMKKGGRQSIRWPMAGEPWDFSFDAQGQLRVVSLYDTPSWRDAKHLAHWYLNDAGQWVELQRFAIGEEVWEPLLAYRPEGKGTRLIVASRHERDARAIYEYDPEACRFTELMAAHPSLDVVSVGGLRRESFRSVITNGLRPQRYWFDARWAALQQAVDKVLPDTFNLLQGQADGLVLIHAYGDREPGQWLLLDTRNMAMKRLLRFTEQLEAAQLRPMETLHYPAADGLQIPAYLTRPQPSGKPQPAVILVHGGPAARDHWGYDTEVQLLASQGYLVLQPQFRGSTGFGKAFERAGYGQWGRAMQDDISAGVRFLIQQGWADPQRICIVGASYGGYAALWGLASTPELYRCGVSVAGVSDIGYMLTDRSDSNQSAYVREVMRFRVGDRDRDRASFDAVSPLQHAARIRAPLLLVHGDNDERVPIEHARKLRTELNRLGRPPQWLELYGAGHGYGQMRHLVPYYNALLKFLDAHLGEQEPLKAP